MRFTVAISTMMAAASSTALAAGNSTSSNNNTVDLFINEQSNDAFAWAGSIVEACANGTVYAVTAISSAGSALAGSNAPSITFTENRAIYLATYTINETINDKTVGAWAQESCGLQNTTAAVCQTTRYTTISGDVAVDSVVPHLVSGTAYHRYNVTITAGAEKTSNPTGLCTPTATASTTSGAARRLADPSGIVTVVAAGLAGLAVGLVAIFYS